MRRRQSRARLEVPIFGPSSASVAVLAGAARLELNAAGSYPDGGTTPSVAELVAVNAVMASLAPAGEGSLTKSLALDSTHGVPVRVMIRPRGPPPPPPAAQTSGARDTAPGVKAAGIDFQYTSAEVDTMIASISELKSRLNLSRGDGFVFGALSVVSTSSADGTSAKAGLSTAPSIATTAKTGIAVSIDEQTCEALLAAAAPFPCVFHRAFDLLVSPPSSSSSSSPLPQHHPDNPSSPAAGESERTRDAVEKVKALGFAGILTSGGVGDAVDNLDNGRLADIVTCAALAPGHLTGEGVTSEGKPGRRNARAIEIILGGGVRSGNVVDVLHGVTLRGGEAGAQAEAGDDSDGDAVQWVHSSCLTKKGSDDVDGDELKRIVDAISD